MASKFFWGSPVLIGDNTIPGCKLPKELEELLPKIFKAVSDFGCDYYPTVVMKVTYDEMSELAAYGGFPVRFPHWKWGMEYEDLQRGYEYGRHKIYEMVINTNPCYIYNLESNTLLDDVLVVSHALGHNDFFKNNIFFSQTSQNMMNKLANHGTRIRKYMSRWGREKVTQFLDYVMRIETLIDPSAAWERKKIKNPIIKDSRKYKHPSRLDVKDGHDYMEEYVNPQKWTNMQRKKIERIETAEQLGLFRDPTKDIMKFFRDHAPLKPWQSDIVAMLYEESMYFAPQRVTKMLNEGWASFVDYEIIARQGYASLGQKTHDAGIVEYGKHKMGVLGGKYSMNPYKLGFCLFQHIEERWNKGRFGSEWEACDDIRERKEWDTKAMLGHDKVFEVRKHYNDVTALMEFFDQDFCDKYEFFDWKKYPNGEYKIESRDHRTIKRKLIERYTNGGLPEIRLLDPNHKGKGHMLLQHKWTGKPLYKPYAEGVMKALCKLWRNDVILSTRNRDGEEVVYLAAGDDHAVDVIQVTREEYEA